MAGKRDAGGEGERERIDSRQRKRRARLPASPYRKRYAAVTYTCPRQTSVTRASSPGSRSRKIDTFRSSSVIAIVQPS